MIKRLLVFCLLWAVLPAGAAIVWDSASNHYLSITGNPTCSTQGSGNITFVSGNQGFLVVSYYDGAGVSPHVTGVSDNAGSDWGTEAKVVATSGLLRTEIWATMNLAADGTHQVTISQTGSGCPGSSTGTAAAIKFLQYSGVAGLGRTTTGGGTTPDSSTPATLTLTTQDNDNFILAAFADYAVQNFTATTGTLRGLVGNNSVSTVREHAGDNTVASPGSVSVAVTTAASTSWVGAAIELRTTTGGETPARRRQVVVVE